MSPSALRRQVGQLLIAGFDGQQIPVELKSLAREFGLGGVGAGVLHRRRRQLRELVGERAPPLHRVDDAGRRLTQILRKADIRAIDLAGGGETIIKTRVVVQYEGDGIIDAHYLYRQNDQVKHQYGCFLASYLRDGVPTVPAPGPITDPCP